MSFITKFGIQIDQDGLDYETIRNSALEGERLGFDSIWLSDHLFLQFPTSYQGDMESLRLFAKEVMPELRYEPSDLLISNHTG